MPDPNLPVSVRWSRVCAILTVNLLIVGVLSIVSGWAFHGMLGRSHCDFRQSKTLPDLHDLVEAVDRFAIDHSGTYPEQLEALLTSDPEGRPYFNRHCIPKDIWGRDYRYDPKGAGHDRARVYTYGRDGKPGGEGDDEDLEALSRE